MSDRHSDVKMYAELKRKRCSKCKQELDLNCFTNNRNGKDGKDHYCRPCKGIIKKEDYVKNRDRIKQQVHESYRRHRQKNLDRANRYRIENREKVLAQKRFASLGITPDQYEKMRKKQKGLCGICKGPEFERKRRFSADHCHDSGVFRGLLCHFCNTGIGLFKEDENLLKLAIEYLNKFKK